MDDLTPVITSIVNSSLSSGIFPEDLKHALIKPSLKKAGLDINQYANYRPISNLSYLGKVIERVAVGQIQTYLDQNSLHAPMQTAYRRHHSTELALLLVQNDILTALDNQDEAILVLLDFTAAFDVLDHDILFHRLSSRYGITGQAKKWFMSYMQGRSHSVMIKDIVSPPSYLECGVPQGSVAGPVIFTLYSAPLQDIISAHGVRSVVYADDTQLYLTFNPTELDNAIKRIEACIRDVRTWCNSNKLVLNDSKTEIIHFTSKFRKQASPPCSITAGDTVIPTSTRVRNLGAIMDSSLTMVDHVNIRCKAAMSAIRKIGQIRHYLDRETTLKLTTAFVTSRLDFCNSLVFGLPDCQIAKLQRVQNTAARLVLGLPKREHAHPMLQQLHWLPVQQRAQFKILLITYKALHGKTPAFISNLIRKYIPRRSLRSSAELLLEMPTCPRTKFYGERSFAIAAATQWNRLPTEIRHVNSVQQFKTKLKTHLFRQCYHC